MNFYLFYCFVYNMNQESLFTIFNKSELPTLVRAGGNAQYRVCLEEMTAPIVICRWQNTTHVCVAVYGHGDYIQSDLRGSPPITQTRGVLMFADHFREYKLYVIEGGDSDRDILGAINRHHNITTHVGSSINICNNCELINDRVSFNWVRNLLNGNNPLFKVGLMPAIPKKEITEAEYEAWRQELDSL